MDKKPGGVWKNRKSPVFVHNHIAPGLKPASNVDLFSCFWAIRPKSRTNSSAIALAPAEEVC